VILDARPDVVADGLDDGTVRVAGDDRGGRRLTVTGVPRVGGDHDHDVFDLVDRPERGLERRLQGNLEDAEPDVFDFHKGGGASFGEAGTTRTMLVIRSMYSSVSFAASGMSGVIDTPFRRTRVNVPSGATWPNPVVS